MADVRDAHLAYRETTTPFVMPAEMIDLEALSALEQEVIDHRRREGKPIPEQVHWVLPRDEEAA